MQAFLLGLQRMARGMLLGVRYTGYTCCPPKNCVSWVLSIAMITAAAHEPSGSFAYMQISTNPCLNMSVLTCVSSHHVPVHISLYTLLSLLAFVKIHLGLYTMSLASDGSLSRVLIASTGDQ